MTNIVSSRLQLRQIIVFVAPLRLNFHGYRRCGSVTITMTIITITIAISKYFMKPIREEQSLDVNIFLYNCKDSFAI